MSELTRQVVMSARSGLTARKSTRVEANLWGALVMAIVTLWLLEVSWRGSLLLSLVLAILIAFGTAIVNQLLGKILVLVQVSLSLRVCSCLRDNFCWSRDSTVSSHIGCRLLQCLYSWSGGTRVLECQELRTTSAVFLSFNSFPQSE